MYSLVLRDVEGVFSSSTWTASSVPTYPMDYQGCKGGASGEYAVISYLPSGSSNYAYGVKKKSTGLVAIKIFTSSGEGQGRLMVIADLLDTLLDNKTLPNGTGLGTSYINIEGQDPLNKSLYSASYIIPFTYYGA